jgi:hypothetical protein
MLLLSWWTRWFISAPVFGLAHVIFVLLKYGYTGVSDANITQVLSAYTLGCIYMIIQHLFEKHMYWYITCVLIHATNNYLAVYF